MRVLHPPLGIEMTHDHPFEARVRRLSIVSLIALGTITWLAIGADASPTIVMMLIAGWLLMPVILRASLQHPKLRFALALPASLVAAGLTAFCMTGLPTGRVNAAGWLAVTAAVWLGAAMGMWLWFRWMPVPAAFENPFGPARLTLVAIHVGGVLAGIGLILT
jgi:hypothetical protein